MILALAVVPVSVLILHLNLYRAIERPAVGVVATNIVPSLLFVVGMLLIPEQTFATAAAAFLISRVLGSGVTVVWLMIADPRFRGRGPLGDWSKTVGIVRSGRRLLVAQMSEFALSWVDLVLLTLWVAPAAIGVYAIAARIAISLNLVQESANAWAGPSFARLGADPTPELAGAVRRLTLRFLVASAIPAALLIVFASGILGLFGAPYVEGSGALTILVLAQMAQVVGGPSRTLLVMSHHESFLAGVFLFAVVANVILNLALIPLYGITGAAFATLVALWSRNGLIVLRANSFLRSSSHRNLGS